MTNIFLIYTYSSITNTFFITTNIFNTINFYNYTTNHNLNHFNNLLFITLNNILLTSLINF
ncbi:hypothetical protein [Klebsiella pneumoniae]|uniref:hypothetical protein n=1 Tax=Klebsiella pneumoniae TaxID=573 RepID=UPI0034D9839A